MNPPSPPSGLSIFFPAYNDAGTIASMVVAADLTARELTDDYEITVVNDASRDWTAQVLEELARVYPRLRIVTHEQNGGYGAALRSGFRTATKPLVFYTDGDAQYDPRELALLWRRMMDEPELDVVNGYKISRSDPFHRVVIGRIYHHTVRLLFGLRLRDVDCDFRLMRRAIFERVTLTKDSGVICLGDDEEGAGRRFPDRGDTRPPLPPRLRRLAVLQPGARRPGGLRRPAALVRAGDPPEPSHRERPGG